MVCFQPSDAICSPVHSAQITDENYNADRPGGRKNEFTGQVTNLIGDSESFDEWTILVGFNQRVQDFDSSFDSKRVRDQNEPVQQRWMLVPKKDQTLAGDMTFTLEGRSVAAGVTVNVWWCPGTTAAEFEITDCPVWV